MSIDYVHEMVSILERLRAPDGCPWDREQTHESLKRYLIEECGELLDALDDGDDDAIVDELGDVLLQIVFHCQIGSEDGRFSLQDAARAECEKMWRRHPHVFGESDADTPEAVLAQWDRLKRQERRHADKRSALDGIPRHLPALHRAQAALRKAGRQGFEWAGVEAVLGKVREELAEVEEACRRGQPEAVAEELGDLLLAVVNLCRWHDLEAEEVLQQGVRKFIRRFQALEDHLRGAGRTPSDCSPAELLDLWRGQTR